MRNSIYPDHIPPRMDDAQPRHRAAALSDLSIVAAAVLAFFTLAAKVDLSEKISAFAGSYEHWQIDELPITLLLLSFGLCWFSYRRAVEARRELKQRVLAQEKIAELFAQNRDLSQRLIATQENERRALARELHDEVGQNCTAIRAEASYIKNAQTSDNVAASAHRIAQAAEDLSAMIRDILGRLRPSALDSLGLASALQELCESWERQTGVACAIFPREIPSDMSDSISTALFRLVQEALTNVTRHAAATQVRIALHLAGAGEKLKLTIQDDGCGMSNPSGPYRGFGLVGMRERVVALHGTIRFQSAPGCGLRIDVELPVETCQS